MSIVMRMILDVEHGYEFEIIADGHCLFSPSGFETYMALLKRWPHRVHRTRTTRPCATICFDPAEPGAEHAWLGVATFHLLDDSGMLREFCRIPICEILRRTEKITDSVIRRTAAEYIVRRSRQTALPIEKKRIR